MPHNGQLRMSGIQPLRRFLIADKPDPVHPGRIVLNAPEPEAEQIPVPIPFFAFIDTDISRKCGFPFFPFRVVSINPDDHEVDFCSS